MICNKCGKEVSGNYKFCKYCGTPLSVSETKYAENEEKSSRFISFAKKNRTGIAVISGVLVIGIIAIVLISHVSNKSSIENQTKMADSGEKEIEEEFDSEGNETNDEEFEESEAFEDEFESEDDGESTEEDEENNDYDIDEDNQGENEETESVLDEESVIEYIREIYGETDNGCEEGIYDEKETISYAKEYWDDTFLRLAIVAAEVEDRFRVGNMTVNYYYDQNGHLIFAWAYEYVNSKRREYRAYYGVDGKLYRYLEYRYKKDENPDTKKIEEQHYDDGIEPEIGSIPGEIYLIP